MGRRDREERRGEGRGRERERRGEGRGRGEGREGEGEERGRGEGGEMTKFTIPVNAHTFIFCSHGSETKPQTPSMPDNLRVKTKVT